MPNRQRLPALPTRARPRDQSDAESWVFVAFCVASYVAIVVLVFLSSHAGQVMAG